MDEKNTVVTVIVYQVTDVRAQSNFPAKSDRAQSNVHTKVPFGLPMLAFAAL